MGNNEVVDPEFATGVIKAQLNGVITNLSAKIKELEAQQTKYTELIRDIDQSKKENVMVLLGDGYFVEHTRKDAKAFLQRRTENIDRGIQDIKSKVKEAQGTYKKFEEYSKHEGFNEKSTETEENPLNEEGLPYMDIREELDEEGNVLAVKMNDKAFDQDNDRVGNGYEKHKDNDDDDDDENDMTTPDSHSPQGGHAADSVTPESLELELESSAVDEVLPIMEIVEELDEHDNVISSKVKSASGEKSATKTFPVPKPVPAALPTPNKKAVPEPKEDAVSKPKEDMVMDIVEVIDENDNVTSSEVKPFVNVEKKIDAAVTDTEATPEISNGKEQMSELLEDMEIIGKAKAKTSEEELLNKIDKLDISADDKFRLKLILLEEYRKISDTDKTEESSKNSQESVNTPKIESLIDEETRKTSGSEKITSGSIAIDKNDILELELLADDFDEDENGVSFADDEEWDFEFSDEENGDGNDKSRDDDDDDDDDDEDDDMADELLYGNNRPDFIANNGLNNRLWNEVMSLRNKNAGNEEEEVPKAKKASTAVKKSVRFAPSLEIFDIENVSEELKNIEHYNMNVSRFKQERLAGAKVPADEIALNKAHSINKESKDSSGAVSDIVVDRSIVEEPEPMQDLTKKKSRFKLMREGNHEQAAPQNVSAFQNEEEKEEDQPLTDIVERDIDNTIHESKITEVTDKDEPAATGVTFEPQTKDTKLHKDEDVISDIVENPISEESVTSTSEPVITDIVENSVDPADSLPEIVKPAKMSRFKMQREAKTNALVSAPQVTETNKPESTYKSVTDEKRPLIGNETIDRKHAIEQSISQVEDKNFETRGKNEEEDIEVVNTTMDYQAMQNDMDTMAKAYVLGMYDDDIETEGPVIDKIEDFELINQIVEARERERKANPNADTDNGENYKGDEEEEEEEEDDDGPVLSDIVEHDNNFNYNDEDEVEDSIIQDEVHTNYQRLRRQLMQARKEGYRKTESELEIEPIDEDGNPIKVSRFRAARLN